MLELLEATGVYGESPSALRRCSRCGELKRTDEFPIKNKTTGLRRVWCRPCCRAYGKEHYGRNRPVYLARAKSRRQTELPRIKRIIDDYLRSHPCVDCGESARVVLDFDHRDRSLKRGIVSRLARSCSESTVRAEIEKCDVRCANCHRRRTAEQFNWTKLLGVIINPAEVRPGAAGRYLALAGPHQAALFSSDPHGVRRCSRCRQLKPLNEFSFRDLGRGLRNHYCRPCHAAYRRAHYERNKPDYIQRAMSEMRMKREDGLLRLHEYLRSHPCVDCGLTDITVLEFDHIDPATKEIDIGSMVGRRSWSTILAEIVKCVVRCANCHRRRTARQQGWKNRVDERRGRYVRMRFTRE
ncbi:MAG: hypothetical protein ACRDGT_03265 [Candidatus Limnocylindria bacterium]